MAELPSGTVTFLFTDIEGSTARWELQPDAMQVALARHDTILRAAILEYGGHVVKTMGDAFHAVFARPADAVAAVLDAQQRLQSEAWGQVGPLRVRMALHTGVAEERDGDYYGASVNRAARLTSTGHGGQVLLSEATASLVRDALPDDATLLDLGEHRLKDLSRPERIYRLAHAHLAADFPPLRSLNRVPNNLPHQLTSFIGRDREMAEVKRLLTATSLLTLVGTGGAGKTRLSLQVAADLVDAYPDGIWLVELAPLAEPSLVGKAVASVLGVREQVGRSALHVLEEHLRSRSLLVVLDNCEHLVAACAALADALLRTCPRLKILATSREALGIAGETTWRVPSLTLPEPAELTSSGLDTVSALTQHEAVRLFIDRALAVTPAFAVTNRNAPAVAQICHRLDGVPLAIELAAARIRVLAPEQIAARLDDRFRLLTGGSRTVLPRQQTLRALVDWSYDLLDDAERTLLQRLSVFAGGWTLEAAEAVCVGDRIASADILDLLTQLVDKSIVLADTRGDTTRYRLLETLRQYGAEKLAASGAAERINRAHRDWFLDLTERAASDWWGPNTAAWINQLTADHDNLRAALRWSLANSDPESIETGLRLAAASGPFWFAQDYLSEGRRWLEAALAADHGHAREPAVSPSAPIGTAQHFLGAHSRVAALNALSRLETMQEDNVSALAHAEEARTLALQAQDTLGLANAVITQGQGARAYGEYEQAAALFEESLGLFRAINHDEGAFRALIDLGEVNIRLGDHERATELLEQSRRVAHSIGHTWGVAYACRHLGRIAYRQGDLDRATTLLEEALLYWRGIGATRGPHWALYELGNVLLSRGEHLRAAASYRESLGLCSNSGDRLGTIRCLEGLAGVEAALQEADQTAPATRSMRAARLLGSATAQREALGTAFQPADRPTVGLTEAAARARVGDAAFAAAWAEGQAMTVEQAIADALEGSGTT